MRGKQRVRWSTRCGLRFCGDELDTDEERDGEGPGRLSGVREGNENIKKLLGILPPMILFYETEGAFIHKHEKYPRTSCSTFVNAEWGRNAVTFKMGSSKRKGEGERVVSH
jgi:hypothetical protein